MFILIYSCHYNKLFAGRIITQKNPLKLEILFHSKLGHILSTSQQDFQQMLHVHNSYVQINYRFPKTVNNLMVE